MNDALQKEITFCQIITDRHFSRVLFEFALIVNRASHNVAIMPSNRPVSLSDQERLDRLRLIRSQNVGPLTFRRVMERFGSASEALRRLPDLARRGGGNGTFTVCPPEDAEREIAATRRLGGHLLFCGDDGYPEPLSFIEDAPPVLTVLGDPAILRRPTIGMVGSRNASPNGRRFAFRLASEMGKAGFATASGLARGIDAAVHQGSLETGAIAVTAGGIDIIYPKENTDLYHAIADGGAIVCEMPLGMHPQARHFPRRNRIISGLSRGVVVIEATLRSGSLITARMALEQGREVFAVPGSPMDPRGRGCNDLLRQGAILVETPQDILNVLDADSASVPPPGRGIRHAEDDARVDAETTDEMRRVIAETLSPVPVTVDEVIRTCQLSPSHVMTCLLEWELAGRVERHPGNKVALIAVGPEQ